jgi:alanyl-tRNA synthetase
MAVDARDILTALIEGFGGRGGGKADLAQGGGLAADLAELAALTRQLLQRATSKPLSLS